MAKVTITIEDISDSNNVDIRVESEPAVVPDNATLAQMIGSRMLSVLGQPPINDDAWDEEGFDAHASSGEPL